MTSIDLRNNLIKRLIFKLERPAMFSRWKDSREQLCKRHGLEQE